ncbi:hypothetical protein HPB49_024739 [Dermacentor silvarum]|uniref:Uncharacterized protein n=1 Tax=Dermacentor silvarum TaxID=543639 RepID=A0ACB8DLE0_DERSI|nr:hypothetical protein HPB49_024739 [Dermacentor silvarum]
MEGPCGVVKRDARFDTKAADSYSRRGWWGSGGLRRARKRVDCESGLPAFGSRKQWRGLEVNTSPLDAPLPRHSTNGPDAPDDLAEYSQDEDARSPRTEEDGAGEVPPANIHLSLPSHLETAKSPPPSSRKKAAICAGCSVALVVVAAVAVSSAWFGKKAWIGRAHCHTKECARVNAMLMEARNASVAPCDNFYQHVCGRWSLNHSGYSVYDRHANEFLNKLADTLIKTVVGTQESPTTKVARFYQTCLMVVVEGRDQTAEYHKAFEMAGVLWPRMGTDGDAYMVEAKLQAYFHASSMLEIRRVKDYGGEVYLRISPANAQAVWRRNLPLLFPRSSGDTSTYRDYYDSACQAYAAGMAGVVGFDTFFDIEKKVYDKTHFDQSEDRKNLTSLTSLAELSDVMRNESAQQLTKFVMATYDLPVATSVTVKGPEYLKRFGELVSELGDDKVIFYLGWLLLQVVWRALDRHTNTLWHKHFRLRVSSHILRQQEVDCLEFTEQLLGWALFYRFTYENSGENSTEMVEQMAENIGRAFKQQLSFNQIFTEVYLTKENFTVRTRRLFRTLEYENKKKARLKLYNE